MASLSSIIALLLRYIMVKRKFVSGFLFLSLPIYFIKGDDNVIRFLILSVFSFDLIIIYSLSFIDDRLKRDGFYKLFDLHPVRICIAKFIILGCILLIHLNLLLLVALKTSFKTDVSVFSSFLAFALSKVLAIRTGKVLISLIIFVVLCLLIAVSFLIPIRPAAPSLFCVMTIIFFWTGYYQFKISSYE